MSHDVLGNCRELLGEVEALLWDKLDAKVIPSTTRLRSAGNNLTQILRHIRDEGKVGHSGLSGNEPLLLRQDRLEHAPDTLDLVLVALEGALRLLRVEVGEPRRLAEVRALAG